MIDGHWLSIDQCDPRGVDLYLSHYSSAKGKRDRRSLCAHGFVGVGEKLVFLTRDGRAVFTWRKEKFRDDGQVGVNNTIFRNTGYPGAPSSALIREACDLAWSVWPGQRLFTFVDAAKTAKRRGRKNPAGHCFIEAGFSACGTTPKGLLILELHAGTTEGS